MSSSQYETTLARIRHISRNLGIDLTLDQNDIDVIIGPADSAFSMLATSAGNVLFILLFTMHRSLLLGYPTVTLPLSYLDFNGRPFGLFAMAKAHREDILLKVMSCWESSFSKRRPPVLSAAERPHL